jgi:hypothetical protein
VIWAARSHHSSYWGGGDREHRILEPIVEELYAFTGPTERKEEEA